MEHTDSMIPDQPEETVLVQPGKKRKRKILAWILVCVILVFAGLGCGFYVNEFRLDIVLDGEADMLVEYGNAYQEPGARAVISGKWLLRDGYTPEDLTVQTHTDFQKDILGKYTVYYDVSFYGWRAEAQRTVRLVDTVSPLITLRDTGKTVLPGQPYEEEGFVAVDNHDGNLTDRVRRTEELGVITYSVMDSSGNPAYVERKIPYFDPEAPELILEGGEEITIPCGSVYSEPGFTASDNADGELTEEVAVVGDVVWYQPGTYEVVYTVADAFGNVTQKIRRVTVEGKNWPEIQWPTGKVIYLTFDDGPGPDTTALLDLLKQYGVKATFFVTNRGSRGELWRMYKEGHSIGMHSMTHDYNSIYASEEAFFNDLYGIQDIIYRETGTRPTLMRFPGGGSNLVSDFNEGIMTRLTQAVQDAGFQYFDWNVDSNDAGGARKRETVANNVIAGVQNQRVSIVLQHDIHNFSVEAVEDIIIWGLNNGYRFLPLTANSPTMQHDVLN